MCRVNGRNINAFTGNQVVRANNAEKIKTVDLFPEEKPVISTQDNKQFESKNAKNTNSAFSFVEETSNEPNINQSLEAFENNITSLVKSSGAKLSPDAAKSIFNNQVELKKIILENKLKTPQDIEHLNKTVSNILISLNTVGSLDDKATNNLKSLTEGILEKTGKDIDSKLELKTVNDNVIGLSSSNKNINPEKAEMVKKLGEMSYDIEKIKSEKGGLTPYKVVLMSLRDELLRHSYDMVARTPENIQSPEPIYKDLGIISNAVSSIDEMLKDTRNLPPNMLSDMEEIVKNIKSNPLGQIEEGLKKLDLSKLDTKIDTPKIPNLDGKNIPDTSMVNKANNALLNIVKGTPRGVGEGIKDAINSYSTLMNGVEKSLPPFLPFPVTLKTPLNYNDGKGNSFYLASGSQISQDKGKGFLVNSPGLNMGLNGTNINSTSSSIQLGKDGIDNLAFGNLSIKDKDTTTNISGFKAEIDRNKGTSFIRADKTTIDLTNGKVDLTNASLVQSADGSINLAAQSFLYDKDNTHIGFEDFQASQSEKDGISNLNMSANNIDLNINKTVINADKFSFQMTHNDNSDVTDMTKISAENVNVLTGGNTIKADKASLDILVNKDGSSSTVLSSENPSVTMASGKLDVVGKSVVSLTQDKNGDLSNLNVKADQINYSGNNQNINVKDGNLNVDFENNNLKKLTASASNVHFDNTNGDKIDLTNGSLNVDFGDNNQIKTATAKASTFNYAGNQGNLNLKDGDLKLNFNDKGTISNINANVKNINWTGKDGQVINGKDTSLDANFYDNGKISDISTKIGNLDYTANGNKLNITNGSANISLDEEGFLKNANGKVDNLKYEGINGDKINANGIDININGDKNGLKDASVKIGSLDYLNNKGDKLNLTNGSAKINADPEGFIKNINGKADKLTYESINGDKINATGLDININGNKNGLTDASIKVGQIDYLSGKGDKVNVTNGSATLTRDSEGLISNITGHADNISLITKDGNTVNANGIDIKIDAPKEGQAGYNLSGSIKDLNASLKEQKLDIKATDIMANINENQMKLHVGSAEVIQKMEKELNVKIENLDLIVDKTKDGNVKGLDLQVEGVNGKIQGMDLQVKTQNGERLRLNMSMSEDGKILKEAFLKIPTGGEIKLQKDDLNIKLGGDQLIKFTQDGKGLYTFRDDGINIEAKTKDAKIQVQGGSAQISLDSKSGNIIIDEIKGTKINAEIGSNKINADIKEIKGFIVKTTGLTGPVTGAMIELKPTGNDSTMTASISANVGGIPVKVDLKDVHELKMLGSISNNEGRVYIGDPSGRGNIKLGAGPLKLEGSAIEFLARYHTYDSQRMMSTMSKYLSTDGLQLGPLSLELDGVVRLEKQSSGLHLGASFILPRGILEDDTRYNLANQGSYRNSWGLIGSIGGQGKSADGTNYVGNLYAGLVPGSFVSIDRKQGDMSLFNIPMPDKITIPSTVVAGLGFRRHSTESRLDATIGGFVNPVGLIPKDSNIPLKDSVQYGGFAGVNFRKANYQFGLDGIVNVDQDKKFSPGVKASFSMSF